MQTFLIHDPSEAMIKTRLWMGYRRVRNKKKGRDMRRISPESALKVHFMISLALKWISSYVQLSFRVQRWKIDISLDILTPFARTSKVSVTRSVIDSSEKLKKSW